MFDNAKKLSSGFYDIEIWLKRECNKPKKKMESKSTIYKILDQSGNESLWKIYNSEISFFLRDSVKTVPAPK